MTYSPSFEKSLKKIDQWMEETVKQKVIVYNGDFENVAGDIKVVNYRNLGGLL